MKRLYLLLFSNLLVSFIAAQSLFDEPALNRVNSLIANREHDKADSILNWYGNYTQNEESSFLMNFARCLNGYVKTQTYQDFSVIVPYAESGKKAFDYLKSNVNEENAESAHCWSILTQYSEIFNNLDDSIIVDIAAFSIKYYRDFHQRDLYSYYTVLLNTFQFLFSRNKWNFAADIMHHYYDAALEAGDSTLRVPISESFIGAAYLKAKDYNNSEKWLINSYNQFQLFPEKVKAAAYCELLRHLAFFYNLQGNNELAYKYAIESCETNKKYYGENSNEYINALGVLAKSEIALNKPQEGLKHLEHAVALLDNTPNMNDGEKQSFRELLNYAYLRLNIKKNVEYNDSLVTENTIILEAMTAFANGNYRRTITKLSYLLEIYEANFQSVDIANFVFVVSSLSNALVSEGEYNKADNVLDKSLVLLQDNNIKSPQVFGLYEAKGLLYFTINNIDMALHWYNMAKELIGKDEKKSIQYATIVSNLAACHYQKGELSIAQKLADEAYSVCSSFYGDKGSNASDVLTILNNIGNIIAKTDDISKAKDIYNKVVRMATTPQTEGIKALALANLGELLWYYELNYEEAEKILNQAKMLNASSYVKDLVEYNLQLIHCIINNEVAISEISSINKNVKEGMAEVFAHFSEAERENYWTQKSQMLVMLNNLALTSFDNRQVRMMAYDNALYTKSMLLNSGRLLESIAKESTPEIKNDIESMQILKRSLLSKSTPKDSIEQLIDSIGFYEKRIIGSIPDFSERLKAQFKSVEDVKAMLLSDEVAIEFIFLPRFIFPFERTELQYGALMITKDSVAPTFIPLCYEKELQSLFDVDNSTNQDNVDKLYGVKDTRLYNMIWTNIEPYLSKTKTVYYSPTGYINKMNLSVISNGTQRLCEKYSIHEVSTTAKIGELKQNNKETIGNAVLFGDINYFEDTKMMAENAKNYKYSSSGDLLVTRSLERNTWELLPGTKDEITYIDGLMKSKGVNSHVFSENNASEEAFKAMDGNAPDVIHVATHGFYLSSQDNITSSFFDNMNSYTKKDSHMFYSGLLFAGANNVWTGKDLSHGVEDGILTAEELSHIDLNGCKLVVLSACNTGLGDINNVDGVFGLQRGFKKAGASTILMSLWKVPDEETSILMQHFYQYYLSGKSAHQSLKLAQKQLINAGKTPYYWAGFVLLD